jgi:hypothetical protein
MHDKYQSGIVHAGYYFAAAATTGQREDTAAIHVSIKYPGDGSFSRIGIWDKRSGGELDSEEVKYYPGAMGEQEQLGGRVVAGNNTLSRLFKGDRDQAILGKLFSAVGKSAVKITEQPLDTDGNAYGNPIVWNGILKKVQSPARDSESTSVAMIEIEVSTKGRPTA